MPCPPLGLVYVCVCCSLQSQSDLSDLFKELGYSVTLRCGGGGFSGVGGRRVWWVRLKGEAGCRDGGGLVR